MVVFVYRIVGDRFIKTEPPEWLYRVDLDDVIAKAVEAKERLVREGRMREDEVKVIFPYSLGEMRLLMHVDLEKGIIERVDVLGPSIDGTYSTVVEAFHVAAFFMELKRKREMGHGMGL